MLGCLCSYTCFKLYNFEAPYSTVTHKIHSCILTEWHLESLSSIPRALSLSCSLLSPSLSLVNRAKKAMDMGCWLSCRTKPNATLHWAWREADTPLCEKQLSVEEHLLELCASSIHTRKVTSRTGTWMRGCTVKINSLYRPCWKTILNRWGCDLNV